MNYTGKHLKKVALKLGYVTIEGKKHTRVYDEERRYITTLPRGKIKAGTLAAIDLPPVVVPSFKLVWGSSQARDPGGA